MIAARLHAWDTAPDLEETGLPGPPLQGEVIVEVEAAAVTHLDLTVMTGTFTHRPALPFTPGTAGVGTVVEGDAALLGRRVLVRGGGIGLERDGTWAERVGVPVDALREVPREADAALAATCYSPMTTAWAAVEEVGRIGGGERVLVTGAAGAVGSLCVQLAARAGAYVVAVVRDEDAAGAVPDAAHEVLVRPAGAEVTVEGEADVLLDTVGGDTVPGFLGAMRPGGRAVLIGYVAGTTLRVDLPTLMSRDVALLPMNMVRRHVPAEVFDRLLGDLTDGRLALRTTALPFARMADAVETRRKGGGRGTIAVLM
ncbi:zinc-binding alcohol dehydrogenase family protein [Streptomyces sp. NEAU-sy36]|uniref:quinone oxidoreductase family protein n=1 Tax=unclassified Streptomyces TaxID=2593676 RepID=UPI0015D5D816|nr:MULTISPECIES: zinc-binding alcohol dehydrogenase family protein [unclassified Streptomyces]QLJ02611.1 zinc-binding alcohol dehydrogenase family protein [Streptomyces sp. NEAU-sy36]